MQLFNTHVLNLNLSGSNSSLGGPSAPAPRVRYSSLGGPSPGIRQIISIRFRVVITMVVVCHTRQFLFLENLFENCNNFTFLAIL